MGRNVKIGVDYFSHDVRASIGPTLYTIQNAFGNDGYAFWFKLWEFVGTQEKLYADFSETNQKDWMYFLSIALVDAEKGEKILKLLADIDAIDKQLWVNRRIVWSDNFRDRVASVYSKRGIPAPKKPTFGAKETQAKSSEMNDEQPDAPNTKGKSKIKYAQYVSMTAEEHQALIDKIGEKATGLCIETLDNYKGSSGHTYKNDYRAILSWVIDSERHKHPELFKADKGAETAPSEGKNPFEEYDE